MEKFYQLYQRIKEWYSRTGDRIENARYTVFCILFIVIQLAIGVFLLWTIFCLFVFLLYSLFTNTTYGVCCPIWIARFCENTNISDYLKYDWPLVSFYAKFAVFTAILYFLLRKMDKEEDEDIEDAEDVEFIEDAEDVEFIEDAEDVEFIEDAEDIEAIEDAEDVGFIKDRKWKVITALSTIIRPLFMMMTTLLFSIFSLKVASKVDLDLVEMIKGRVFIYIGVLALAYIGNVFSDLLFRNPDRKPFLHLIPTAVVALGLCAVLLTEGADIKGGGAYVPSANEVEDVYVYESVLFGPLVELKEKPGIENAISLHRCILSSRKDNLAAKRYKELYYLYCFSDGSYMTRKFYIENNDSQADLKDLRKEQAMAYDAVFNCQEAALYRSLPPENYEISYCSVFCEVPGSSGGEDIFVKDLSKEQTEYFYENCLKPDALEGKTGFLFQNKRSRITYPTEKTRSTVYLNLSFTNKLTGERLSLAPQICMEAERCLLWLKENIDLSTQSWSEYLRMSAELTEY